jgi:hypothetical protein
MPADNICNAMCLCSLRQTKETVWIPPADMLDPQLTAAEVQEVLERCNTDQARWDDLVKASPAIVTLQAHIRGRREMCFCAFRGAEREGRRKN